MIFVAVKGSFQLVFLDTVHLFLGIRFAIVDDLAGKSHQYVKIIISVRLDVTFEFIQVAYRM